LEGRVANFRIETNLDSATGLYFAELYYPDSATEPLVRTTPRFPSIEVAEEEIKLDMIAAFNVPVRNR
jgi:hypothetical protein